VSEVRAQEAGLDALDAAPDLDALCLFVAEDERPLTGLAGFVDWRLCGQLSRLLVRGFFTGEPKDKVLLPSEGRLGPPRIFAIGVGKKAQLDPLRLSEAFADAAVTLNKAQSRAVAIGVPGGGQLDDAVRAAAFTAKFLPAFHGEKVLVLSERTLTKLLAK
jgi:hypothetical protein